MKHLSIAWYLSAQLLVRRKEAAKMFAGSDNYLLCVSEELQVIFFISSWDES